MMYLELYDLDNLDNLDNVMDFRDEDGIYPPEAEFMLKATNPYSYDPFYVYSGPDKKINGCVYSDRLEGWDREKFRAAAQRVFGTNYPSYRKNPKDVERFMQDYTGESKLVLCKIVEFCNQATGYPCWRIDYHVPK